MQYFEKLKNIFDEAILPNTYHLDKNDDIIIDFIS